MSAPKSQAKMDAEVEKVWREFWAPLVMKKGKLDLQQVKRELFDFANAMDNVARVYCHITGGKLSKITYDADVVIAEADDHVNNMIDEAVKEALRDHIEEQAILAKLSKPEPKRVKATKKEKKK